MWEVFKTIITSPAGSFAFVISIAIFFGWAIRKLTQIDDLAKNKSACVDKLENNIDKIKEDIQAIKAYLSVIQNGKANLTESHSPVTLTPLGQDIAKKMDIYTMISKNWTHIYEFISSKMSQENAYDIQQFCIDTATTSLEKFFLPEDLINIKSFAYKNGNPTAYYGSMIGVIIRDKYFETKGINISEVDNHKP